MEKVYIISCLVYDEFDDIWNESFDDNIVFSDLKTAKYVLNKLKKESRETGLKLGLTTKEIREENKRNKYIIRELRLIKDRKEYNAITPFEELDMFFNSRVV